MDDENENLNGQRLFEDHRWRTAKIT